MGPQLLGLRGHQHGPVVLHQGQPRSRVPPDTTHNALYRLLSPPRCLSEPGVGKGLKRAARSQIQPTDVFSVTPWRFALLCVFFFLMN